MSGRVISATCTTLGSISPPDPNPPSRAESDWSRRWPNETCVVQSAGDRWSSSTSNYRANAMRRKLKRQPNTNRASCLYECEQCGLNEQIPADVLDYFDEIDPGEPGAPATFQCQVCPGIMYPAAWLRAKRATP